MCIRDRGKDAGEVAGIEPNGVLIGDDSAAAIRAAQCVIDFTIPEATVAHARVASENGVAMVIGTTGLDPIQTTLIQDAASKVPIMWAANMALGVNILLALVEKTASMLDPSYDIEVLEMHHRHKIDAPSGTALALGRAAAAGRKVQLEDVWRKSRDGHTGARPTGEIGFATLRGGRAPAQSPRARRSCGDGASPAPRCRSWDRASTPSSRPAPARY